MIRKSLLSLTLASALAAGFAGPSLAEDDNDSWWPRWGMGRMFDGSGHGGGMWGEGPDAMLDRIDGRLAFMKAELKITTEQEAVWTEVASVVKTTAESQNAMKKSHMDEMRSGEFWKKPLPERLTFQETMLSSRLEQVKTVKAAVEKLYGVLSDEQKKVADDIVLPTMGMGMGRGMGRGMMRMMQE